MNLSTIARASGAVVFGATLAASCGGAQELVVENAWSRPSPMLSTPGVAYFDVTASSADELVGVSVSADIAAEAQIHQTQIDSDDGMEMSSDEMEMEDDSQTDMSESMTMAQVHGITLPKGETVSLEPGGYHVMLLDLTSPLEDGTEFEITLDFANAEDKVVTVTVGSEPSQSASRTSA